MSEVLDFKNAGLPEQKNYLTPGVYNLTFTDAKFDNSGKTPAVVISLVGEDGQMTHKFWLTGKALARLNYVHNELYGKPIDKAFESAEQAAAYFKKLFDAKKMTKKVRVQGRQGNDGKVYADLGYADFILADNAETKVFEEGSNEWNKYVTKNPDAGMLAGNSAARLPSADGPNASDGDDLPF